MKKLVGLTISALLVMGLVVGGTFAYFADTETSSANNITAGTLDLTLDGGDANVNIIAALTDKKPTDSDMAPGPKATLAAAGTLTGDLTIAFGTVTNTEAVGGTEHEGGGSGELGGYVEIAPWLDLNQDGTFDVGSDIALTNAGGTSTAALQWGTVDSFDSDTYTDVITGFTGSDDFYLPWEFVDNAADQNDAQGDAFTIGITFTLNQ